MKSATSRWQMVLVAIPALVLGACASDPGEPRSGDWTVVNTGGESHQVSSPSVTDTAITEKAGCTHIRFCNAAGAQEVVCDTDDASCTSTQRFNECMQDADVVCGMDWNRMDFDPAIPCPITGICTGGPPISLITRD